MTRRKTTEQFEKELAIANPTVEVLGEYKGSRKPIKVRCKKHDVVWEPSAASILRGSGCNMCKREKISKANQGTAKYTDNYLEKYINSHFNEQYTFIRRIKGKSLRLDRVELKCNICGNNRSYLIYNVMRKGNGRFGCYECLKVKARKPEKQFKEELEKYCRGRYTLIGKYGRANTKTDFLCNKCNHIFSALPRDIIRGNWGCPRCSQSTGEKYIENYLLEHGIGYEYPKMFEDLVDTKKLHYDFYLPDSNVLIEYQGLQHYEPRDYFGGLKAYKKQLYHDKLKRRYAVNNGYRLLEVAYKENTQEKVNSYLDKNL